MYLCALHRLYVIFNHSFNTLAMSAMIKNILVPIGTSPDSYHTLQYAVNFAKEFSANVYVMEVFNVSVGARKKAWPM